MQLLIKNVPGPNPYICLHPRHALLMHHCMRLPDHSHHCLPRPFCKRKGISTRTIPVLSTKAVDQGMHRPLTKTSNILFKNQKLRNHLQPPNFPLLPRKYIPCRPIPAHSENGGRGGWGWGGGEAGNREIQTDNAHTPTVVPALCILNSNPLVLSNLWTSAIWALTLAVGVPMGIKQKSAIHIEGVGEGGEGSG
jgi:hypothetical protein